jgi:hypothetical protein
MEHTVFEFAGENGKSLNVVFPVSHRNLMPFKENGTTLGNRCCGHDFIFG